MREGKREGGTDREREGMVEGGRETDRERGGMVEAGGSEEGLCTCQWVPSDINLNILFKAFLHHQC